tara:strand:+ start:28089 stop:28529 length:441 start_codon:yes stop_codon:yes gene_type:complete
MNIKEWPEGATHKIEGIYTKWVGGTEYSWMNKKWEKQYSGFLLSYYVDDNCFEIIERPLNAPYMPKVDGWFTAANGDEYMLIGKTSYGHFVVESRETVVIRFPSLEGATPIKTERELLIDIMLGVGNMSEGVLADTILAAGFTNKP